MKPDFEALRRTAEYAGLADHQIERKFFRLDAVSVEALQLEVIGRGLATQQDVEITWRLRGRL